MAIKLGINGFGRIGRLVLRVILESKDDVFDVVGINDITDAETLAHLFKYDSIHGIFPGEVQTDGSTLIVNGERFPVYAERDPGPPPVPSPVRTHSSTVNPSNGVSLASAHSSASQSG